MSDAEDLLAGIGAGSDLWVVLESGEAAVESRHLVNLLVAGETFWGKARDVQSSDSLARLAGRKAGGPALPVSVAYNNFASLACASNLSRRCGRFFSTAAYTSVRFVTGRRFHRIWDAHSGGEVAPIASAVRSGRRLKIKIVSDGYAYILPLHTVEAKERDNAFTAYTEFDGYPNVLRFGAEIRHMAAQFDRLSTAGRFFDSGFQAVPFWHTYFELTERGLGKVDFENDRTVPFPCDEASFYAEE